VLDSKLFSASGESAWPAAAAISAELPEICEMRSSSAARSARARAG
jgi:hypothetical protein